MIIIKKNLILFLVGHYIILYCSCVELGASFNSLLLLVFIVIINCYKTFHTRKIQPIVSECVDQNSKIIIFTHNIQKMLFIIL